MNITLPGASSQKRIVVMISGSGSNLQAIIDAVHAGNLDAGIALVVSNRKAAYGLERAQAAGIPTLYFSLKAYREQGKSREEYDRDLAGQVARYQPDLVVLAGWMHIFNAVFLSQFPGKVINLHPALPGTFPGTDAITRAYEAHLRGEVSQTGCMVHYVIPEVDAGPVIATAAVEICPTDDLPSLEARMHETEHRLIVDSIRTALRSS